MVPMAEYRGGAGGAGRFGGGWVRRVSAVGASLVVVGRPKKKLWRSRCMRARAVVDVRFLSLTSFLPLAFGPSIFLIRNKSKKRKEVSD